MRQTFRDSHNASRLTALVLDFFEEGFIKTPLSDDQGIGRVTGQVNGDFTLVISREAVHEDDVIYGWQVFDARDQVVGSLKCSLAAFMRQADACVGAQLHESSAKGAFSSVTGDDALDFNLMMESIDQDVTIGAQRALEDFCAPLIIGNPRFFAFLNATFDDLTAKDRLNIIMSQPLFGDPAP